MSGGTGSARATAARLAAWLGLAYLGYWLALLMDRALGALIARAAHRAEILDVSVSPFTIFVSVSYKAAAADRAVFSSLPTLASVLLLLALWWSGRRRRQADAAGRYPAASALAWWTGLWAILQIVEQLGVFAWLGRGRFATLLGAGFEDRSGFSLRVRVTAVASLLLLAAGAMCVRRLLELWRHGVMALPPDAGKFSETVLAAIGVSLPVVSLLAFPMVPSLSDGFGPRLILFLAVPALSFLLMMLVGGAITRITAGTSRASAQPADAQAVTFSTKGALAAIGAAAILYFSLSYADQGRRWNIESGMASISSSHYTVRYNAVDPPGEALKNSVKSFAESREQLLSQQAARLRVSLQDVRLQLVVFSQIDALRAATRDPRPFVVEGKTIRAFLPEFAKEIDPAADALALLYSVWGKPGSPAAARWVARWLAGTWRDHALAAWRARIEGETGRRSLAELFDGGDDNQVSPLEREPLLGDWVAGIASRHGVSGVRKVYESGPRASHNDIAGALNTSAAQLENEWEKSAPPPDAANALAEDHHTSLAADFYWAGISFSHEGWQNGRGGYASMEARKQLAKIRQLGANAVALVPYGFVPSAADPLVRYTTTDETDLDLTQAAFVAHALGMKVMLKPQLWVSFGKFTGELRFDDPAERARWMKSYREFILHYARLAELEQFDLLCIGTELEGLTVHPDDWRRLIAEVRDVYHGPLTYAAHFGQEFETLQFGDALDYLGLNNYYPLSDGPVTSAGQLRPRAEALAAKLDAISARWHRPILFTETGYPSVQGGVAQPWIEGDGRPPSVEEQAAGYEATFRAFTGRPSVHGMFWWKWPSDGREGGAQDTSFSPVGKPAENVLRNWLPQTQPGPPGAAQKKK